MCFPFSIDDNECQNVTNICGERGNCTNTVGSYYCTCVSGYTSTGQGEFQPNDGTECIGNVQVPRDRFATVLTCSAAGFVHFSWHVEGETFSTPALLVEQHLQALLIFLYWGRILGLWLKPKKKSMKRRRFAGFWSWFINIACIFYAWWNHSLSSKRNYTVFGIKWGWLSLLLGTVLLLFFTHLQAGRHTTTTTTATTTEMCM